MKRPYSRLTHSFSIAEDLFKITFLTKGYEQRSFLKRVLDPELWCLIIIALLITTQANAQKKDCDMLIAECAQDITVECGDMLDPAYVGEPIINKDPDCPLVVQVGWLDYTMGNCPKVVTRIWTVTDEFGNTESCTQMITVLDTIAPVFTYYPQDMTVTCDQVPMLDEINAIDNCKKDLIVDFEEVILAGNCDNEYTIVRTWSTVDDCQNTAITTQTVWVIDTVAPTIYGVPADVTVNCNSVPEPDSNVTAEDNCKSMQTVYPSDVILPGNCPSNYVIERTWWAEDGCGNVGWATQIITVTDDQAPVLSDTPLDVTVECDNVPVIPEISATDDCKDEIPVIYTENVVAGSCAHSYTIERTWTATDDCGNIASHTQVVTVEDNTPPQIYLIGDSGDKVILCSEQIPETPGSMAVDNCDDNVTVQATDTTYAGSCANEWTIQRWWTASDACGNTTTLTQVIQVIDTVAPQFNYIPADMTLACGEQIPFEDAEAMDNCDSDPSMMYEDDIVPGNCAGEYTLLRTWITTDDCGNSSMALQTIWVIDTVGPVFDDILPDTTVSCGSMPPVPECTATDACEGFVPAFFDGETTIPGNCPGSYTLIRSWTAFDDCGNSTTQLQTITVIDTLPPMLVALPNDTTVSCDDIPDPALVEAMDDCDQNVSLVLEETEIEGNCEGDFTLVRKWIATDGCGNSAFAEQWITVIDTIPPSFYGVPQDMTVECNNIPDPAEVTAWDACKSFIPVNFTEDNEQGSCKDSYQIVRTWVADDGCGNMNMAVQVITVIDTVAPVFDCILQDLTVDCNTIPDPLVCFSTDNCDEFPTENFTEVWSGSGCVGVYTITRTYSSTDNCGNTTSIDQVITVDNGPGIPNGIEDAVQHGIQLTAYPNPFNEETMIRFILPGSGEALLEVFDMRGRVVEVLFDGQVAAGTPVAREFRPQEHHSGSYIYRLTTGENILHGRLVLTR